MGTRPRVGAGSTGVQTPPKQTKWKEAKPGPLTVTPAKCGQRGPWAPTLCLQAAHSLLAQKEFTSSLTPSTYFTVNSLLVVGPQANLQRALLREGCQLNGLKGSAMKKPVVTGEIPILPPPAEVARADLRRREAGPWRWMPHAVRPRQVRCAGSRKGCRAGGFCGLERVQRRGTVATVCFPPAS